MTAIDRPRPRPASPVVLPLVASVGSPWDEWSTAALPAVVGAGVLDAGTVALPVAALDAGTVVLPAVRLPGTPVVSERSRRADAPLAVVPSPRPARPAPQPPHPRG